MYIEKATGTNHDGSACIGCVRFSRTVETAYFSNKGKCDNRQLLGKRNLEKNIEFRVPKKTHKTVIALEMENSYR
ncbi:hypothetical protein BH09BAC1_BH09BAC1_15950 [soil metagenome]